MPDEVAAATAVEAAAIEAAVAAADSADGVVGLT